jgi:hypothetical protein
MRPDANLPRIWSAPNLVELCWRLQAPHGVVFECGLYRMRTGIEVRLVYGDDYLLYSEFAVDRRCARAAAVDLKAAILQDTPVYSDLPTDAMRLLRSCRDRIVSRH